MYQLIMFLLDRWLPILQVIPNLLVSNRFGGQELLLYMMLRPFFFSVAQTQKFFLRRHLLQNGLSDRLDPMKLISISRIKNRHLIPDVVAHVCMQCSQCHSFGALI